MDIKELRIGSSVLFNGERVKVQRIEGDDVTDAIICERGWIPLEELDPIPITEELLKELGFEKDDDKPFSNILFKEIPIEIGKLWMKICPAYDEEEGWSISVGSYRECRTFVKYLHELEAFVYLTTKQELI